MFHHSTPTGMEWNGSEYNQPSHVQKKHRTHDGMRMHEDIFDIPSIDSSALQAYNLASQSIDSIPGILDSEDSINSKQSTPTHHSYDQSDFNLGEDDGFFDEIQEMGQMSDMSLMGASQSSSQSGTKRYDGSEDNGARKTKRPRNQLISNASTDINSAHKSKVASLINKNKAAFKPVVKIPHMLASDIRKNYTVMWGNAFNAYEPKLLLDFLMRYVRQDSTLVKAFPQGGNDVLSFPSHIQLHGKKELLLYWLGVLFLSPDQVIVHDYVRIEPRKDGIPGSKIICRLQVRGTRPFSLSLSELIEQINNLVNDKIAAEGRNVHDISDEEYMQKLLTLDPYQCVGDIEGRMQTSVVTSTTLPGPLNVVGMFSFLLDSNKYVESMDYSIAPDTMQHRSYFND